MSPNLTLAHTAACIPLGITASSGCFLEGSSSTVITCLGAARAPLLLLRESRLSTGYRNCRGGSTPWHPPPTLCAPTSTAGLWKRLCSCPSISSFPFQSSLRLLDCQGMSFSCGLWNASPVGFQQSASSGKQISPVIWEKTTNLGGDCIFCQNKACLLQKPLIPPRLRAFCRGSQQTWLLLLLKSLNLVYREGRGGGERTESEAP